MSEALGHWRAAQNTETVDIWTEYLDRTQVADCFAFLADQDAIRVGRRPSDIAQWIQHVGGLTEAELQIRLYDPAEPIVDRLALVTFVRWRDRLSDLLLHSTDETLPSSGVVLYFSDRLAVSILVGYRHPGSTIDLQDFLAIPDPELLFDPFPALQERRTDQEIELIRRALFQRHKIVVHRNVLTHVDREADPDVFGPTIDTLVLNERLFSTRYEPQRTPERREYFDDIMPFDLAAASAADGVQFLEVGSGNGLLTASFARNEASIRRLVAVDIAVGAIAATHRNSAKQRRLPNGRTIADRAHYIVGRYDRSMVPGDNDLVVCNPPYIPVPSDASLVRNLHPLARATLGVDLLEDVTRDCGSLLKPDGQLLIVASEMAEEALRASVPDGFRWQKVDTRTVPFDIGPLRREQAILRWLRGQGWLSGGGGRRGYTHRIAIYVVERGGTTD